MMHGDYPRGDARAEIIRERDDAEHALSLAKRVLNQLDLPAAIPH